MRMIVAVLVGALALGGVAHAQSAPAPSRGGYVAAVGQSAFGNVTSQAFGAEVGVNLLERVQVFLEGSHVNDTAPASLGENAQAIANFLSSAQASPASFQAKQPVSFVLAGVRVLGPRSGSLQPYGLGGVGVARVSKNVTFALGGQDVTTTLTHYGVVLGSDLAGDETKPMIGFGGGVLWHQGPRFVVDLQYRYGRVLATGQGISINRAGVGLGLSF
jgi:opacity protein-like surface antigen